MLIYNVTINIEDDAHDEWLFWMKEQHIPDMLRTGKFLEATMCQVLIEEDMGGTTYSVQYKVKDRGTLEMYYKEDAAALRNDAMKRFGKQFVAFRTELEVVAIEQNPIQSATEYLFAYGTLQDEAVQNMVFSRTLSGTQDILKNHTLASEMVGGLYPTLNPSKEKNDQVSGEVFVVSNAELLRADSYEGDAYYRKKVTLASGIKAWVYLGNSNTKDPNPEHE
jgi:gamma-glutamylcyclotransferase (GGCT)/AIG2-like uncharacterized protein YtfP